MGDEGLHSNGNRIDDALSVSCDTVNHRRRHGVQEVKPDEIEARLVRNDAALVNRLIVGINDRQIDPREPALESRAPDHVRDVEDTAIR